MEQLDKCTLERSKMSSLVVRGDVLKTGGSQKELANFY